MRISSPSSTEKLLNFSECPEELTLLVWKLLLAKCQQQSYRILAIIGKHLRIIHTLLSKKGD